VNPRVLYAACASPAPSLSRPAYFVQVCKQISKMKQNTKPNPGLMRRSAFDRSNYCLYATLCVIRCKVQPRSGLD